MSLWVIVVFLSVLTSGNTINRPVYKVILTQRGYTQFLQYDEIPPLREFTFCIWIRVYDLDGDQSIFTYIANGNHRLLRLWLRSGGKLLHFSINGKTTTTVPVDMAKDVWRHVCITYQSAYGAWGIYVDSKLLSCETRRSLYNVVLPGGGSIILGYGTANNGISNGLEGELFGANLFLKSTIEGDNIVVPDYLHQQKHHHKNKIRQGDRNIKYVILSQLENNETQNGFEKALISNLQNQKQRFIKIHTPHSLNKHEISSELDKLKVLDKSNEKEIMEFSEINKVHSTTEEYNIKFWNLVNQAGREGKFRGNKMQFGSGSTDLPVVLEYDTPPSPMFGESQTFYNTSHNLNEKEKVNEFNNLLPDIETPPLPQRDNKVYGQWTSSKFAGNVLNYLRSINYRKPEKKPPITIPLTKISDNFPYASEYKITKLRPPVQFKRKSIDYKSRIYKRGVTKPQINVEILENDLRSSILKTHAETKPKDVVIINRGDSHKSNSQRSLLKEKYYSVANLSRPKPFAISSVVGKKNKETAISQSSINKQLKTILPFIKSFDYQEEDSQKKSSENSSDMYSKSLSNGNKWHNVKSYNNDYTPRRINIETESQNSNMKDEIAERNLLHPYVRLKYRPEAVKLTKDRELARAVPNQMMSNLDTISILNYNHGNLPSPENIKSLKKNLTRASNSKPKTVKNNFNQQVKLGNALNEHLTIGENNEQKMQSFIEGHNNVPDINKYRSDDERVNIHWSENVRVCSKPERSGQKLYVQRDESITLSNKESPIRKKNVAIEFVQQNYIQCSLEESIFAKSYLILIDWNNTPVRLFGGAFPKTTTDLCGFF